MSNTEKYDKLVAYETTNALESITERAKSLTTLLYLISTMKDSSDLCEVAYVASGYLEQIAQDLEDTTAEMRNALKAV